MRLLLLLSVLLSALTGAGASARVSSAAHTVAERSVVTLALAPAQRAVNLRPMATVPVLRAVAELAGEPVAVSDAEPLWANRRRE
ncbi:hypothetical protein [Sphingomonas sp.]|jgi:hypothetical protein|uniref:hypothetical protein n=1 Tax=Sphingomonas sp. TaxID=28214 RepID=UPI002ED783F0